MAKMAKMSLDHSTAKERKMLEDLLHDLIEVSIRQSRGRGGG
jgi:hypothetical protein